jgi:hypothetical protein
METWFRGEETWFPRVKTWFSDRETGFRRLKTWFSRACTGLSQVTFSPWDVEKKRDRMTQQMKNPPSAWLARVPFALKIPFARGKRVAGLTG